MDFWQERRANERTSEQGRAALALAWVLGAWAWAWATGHWSTAPGTERGRNLFWQAQCDFAAARSWGKATKAYE